MRLPQQHRKHGARRLMICVIAFLAFIVSLSLLLTQLEWDPPTEPLLLGPAALNSTLISNGSAPGGTPSLIHWFLQKPLSACPSVIRQRLMQLCPAQDSHKQPRTRKTAVTCQLASLQKEGAMRARYRAAHPGSQRGSVPSLWNERVAICLIGGARNFELTGISLRKHLLSAYPNSDSFILATKDKETKKLSILTALRRGSRLMYMNVSDQDPIDESKYPVHLLDVPHLQGQLQQFHKVEMCGEVITAFESVLGFRYDWILWTRLDAYWHAPPPPLSSLSRTAYHVPRGFNWGGLNDRFAVGRRDVMLPALKRLSSLHQLAHLLPKGNATRGLNGEKALKQQLEMQGIPTVTMSVPFCIVSFARRKSDKFPFAYIWGPEAKDGGSCRPCQRHRGWFCHPGGGHESYWTKRYAEGASEEDNEAERYLSNRGPTQCRWDWVLLEKSTCLWHAPSKWTVCV